MSIRGLRRARRSAVLPAVLAVLLVASWALRIRARTYHQPSAGASDLVAPVLTRVASRSLGRLDELSPTPASPSRRAPRMPSRDPLHLRRLAANAGEKSGRAVLGNIAISQVPPVVVPPSPPAGSQPGGEPEPVLGAPAEIAPAARREPRLRVAAGTRLFAAPDPRSPQLAVVDVESELPVVERAAGWARVRYAGVRGWVEAPGGGGDGAVAQAAYRPPPPDPARLERARALLGGAEERRLGPFRLLTDLRDERLLAALGRLAAGLPELYAARYGVDPGPPAEEAVVLFSREEDYVVFAGSAPAIAGLESNGLATQGIAALAAGGRPVIELRTLLVHELVHLLDRRAFGTALPPWLEEGMAEDLSYCRVDRAGGLLPGTLDLSRSEMVERDTGSQGQPLMRRHVSVVGPRSLVDRLAEKAAEGRIWPLRALVAAPWADLVDPEQRPITYPESAMFVRYLLDAGGPPGSIPGQGPRAAALRELLTQLAARRPADASTLLARLGTTWDDLEPAFTAWLAAQHGPEIR